MAEAPVEVLAAELLAVGLLAEVAEREEAQQAPAVVAAEVVDRVNDLLHDSQLCNRSSEL